MNAAKMEYEILSHHFGRNVYKSYVRAYGIAVYVCRPRLVLRLGGNARAIPEKRIIDVDINRHAVALRLPVARHGNLIPLAHVIVLTIEISRSFFGVSAPMEIPFPVEAYNLFTLLPFRRHLQRGMIRQLVDTQHSGILPVGYRLCLSC